MRSAIIDLGTNTFNLLIADVDRKGIKEFIYKAKMPSKLGQDGINKSILHQDAMDRGVKILKEYKKIIDKHMVDKIFAYATSAIRTAANGEIFVQCIKKETDIDVTIISGKEEASLIFKGVQQSVKEIKDSYLIVDIGGGSTEFVLVENNEITWLKSYPLGMARLLERFKPSEPITAIEIAKIEQFLEFELKDMIAVMKDKKLETLVGSSGSFDTILSMVSHYFFTPGTFKKNFCTEISREHFSHLYNSIIQTNLEERKEMPGMDLLRVDMMVLAMVFTHFIINKLGIFHLYQTKYALKEGILFKISEDLK
jgi:exopolyphosphatase/guanosine-5'-triphosphate,3'-diphosphate pyrophosphatase